MKTLSKILAVALLTACAEINPQTATQTPENEIILKENGAQTRAAQALEPGDEIGLFATKSAQPLQPKNNAINNAKLLVQSDLTIKGEQVIYYPNRTDKVDFYSYFPYQSGNATADALGVLVGIRTTQTDIFSLKSSDLCYGSAKAITPTNSAQSITYQHAFAQLKLIFSAYTDCPAIKSVKLLNIKDSAELNLAKGTLTLRSHLAEITPQKLSSTEFFAIVPAQALTGECLAVTLTDNTTRKFYLEQSLDLTAGAVNVLNLSVLDKSVVVAVGAMVVGSWEPIAHSAKITQSVDNQVTMRWQFPHSNYASVDKISLTLIDNFGNQHQIDVRPTLDAKSSAAEAIYQFRLQKSNLSYRITISRIMIYSGSTLLRDTPQYAIIGSQLNASGAHVLGLFIYFQSSWQNDWMEVSGYGESKPITIAVNGVDKWSATTTGTGFSITPSTGVNGQVATIKWAPNMGATIPATRHATVTFSTVAGGPSFTIKTSQLGALSPVRINDLWWARTNVGATLPHEYGTFHLAGTNPCPSGWRVPTIDEWCTLYGNVANNTYWGDDYSYAVRVTEPYVGIWVGPNAKLLDPNTAIFLPAAGYQIIQGGYYNKDHNGYYWSSSQHSENEYYSVHNVSSHVSPKYPTNTQHKFSVRCVMP